MSKTIFYISETAKSVQVENHVLRYWEEELGLPVKRNAQGHRYYTKEDILVFKRIKQLKERGLQLKAIKLVLAGDRLERAENDDKEQNSIGYMGIEGDGKGYDGKEWNSKGYDGKERNGKEYIAKKNMSEKELVYEENPLDITRTSDIDLQKMGIKKEESELKKVSKVTSFPQKDRDADADYTDKVRKLQMLLKLMIGEIMEEYNEELCAEMKSVLIKEMDYQFRAQEERNEEKEKTFFEKLESLFSKKRGRENKFFHHSV